MRKFICLIFTLALAVCAFPSVSFAADMSDGTYEVSIALWHSEDDKASMAADAIGTAATIKVENGVRTMYITSGEMSMMGIKASLQELKIAGSDGSFTDAKVTAKDTQGNPTGFYFTVPHANEYITVKVNPYIALMGNKDIGARIKVDYSTLRLVKAAETESVSETQVNDICETEAPAVTESTIAVTEYSTAQDYTEGEALDYTEALTQSEAAQVQADDNKDGLSKPVLFAAAGIVIILALALIIKKRK